MHITINYSWQKVLSVLGITSGINAINSRIKMQKTECWPEWDSTPRPLAYHRHTLTTELSGRTINCA